MIYRESEGFVNIIYLIIILCEKNLDRRATEFENKLKNIFFIIICFKYNNFIFIIKDDYINLLIFLCQFIKENSLSSSCIISLYHGYISSS